MKTFCLCFIINSGKCIKNDNVINRENKCVQNSRPPYFTSNKSYEHLFIHVLPLFYLIQIFLH